MALSFRTRLHIAAALALAGAATGLAVFATDAALWRGFSREEAAMLAGLVLASGAGGLSAGLITAPLWGRSGDRGAWAVIAGAALTTVLGGVVGGTLIAPGAGTILGPVVIAFALVERPLCGLVWIAAMYLVQRRARRLRQG
jgi:hypothetical protein